MSRDLADSKLHVIRGPMRPRSLVKLASAETDMQTLNVPLSVAQTLLDKKNAGVAEILYRKSSRVDEHARGWEGPDRSQHW